MIGQFKIDKSIALKEAQIMQKAPEEAHIEQEAPEEVHIEREALEEAQVLENCEISVSYVHTGENGFEIILLLTIFLFSKWPLKS